VYMSYIDRLKTSQSLVAAFNWLRKLLVDPHLLTQHWRSLYWYFYNRKKWARLNQDPNFRFTWRHSLLSSSDRYKKAGSARGHYFWQDLWAAGEVSKNGVSDHVDIGSRIDGFVAHIMSTCRVHYVDLRPIELSHPNFIFEQGSILDLPFVSGSVRSLSCLHVIEHIGLGRYGDAVDPEGYMKAAAEISRVLAPSGKLLLGTPVGIERLCFDAHRVFDPSTMLKAFASLRLVTFHLIPDRGDRVINNASFDEARTSTHGCGLFEFVKI